jgi:hypothetical protein
MRLIKVEVWAHRGSAMSPEICSEIRSEIRPESSQGRGEALARKVLPAVAAAVRERAFVPGACGHEGMWVGGVDGGGLKADEPK